MPLRDLVVRDCADLSPDFILEVRLNGESDLQAALVWWSGFVCTVLELQCTRTITSLRHGFVVQSFLCWRTNMETRESIARRILGSRSLLSWVFGMFFSDASNTSGLLAIALVAAVIYIYIKQTQVPERLLDAVFIIVGFYFGGATAKKQEPQPEP